MTTYDNTNSQISNCTKRSSDTRSIPPNSVVSQNEMLRNLNVGDCIGISPISDLLPHDRHGSLSTPASSVQLLSLSKSDMASLQNTVTYGPEFECGPTERRGTKRKNCFSSSSRRRDSSVAAQITTSSGDDLETSADSNESQDVANNLSANSQSDTDGADPRNIFEVESAGALYPKISSPLATKHATVVAHCSADGTGIGASHSLFETDPGSLIPPNRDPCFHFIRKTFHKLSKTEHRGSDCRNDTDSETGDLKRKHRSQGKSSITKSLSHESPLKSRRIHSDNCSDESGASSGSGTEGGYAASSSSAEREARTGSCSSQMSEESSEDSGSEQRNHAKSKFSISGDPNRPMLSRKLGLLHCSSSEIADFSSSTSEVETDSSEGFGGRLESPSISSTSNCGDPSDDDEQQEIQYALPGAEYRRKASHRLVSTTSSSRLKSSRPSDQQGTFPSIKKQPGSDSLKMPGQYESEHEDGHPLMTLGCDIMAHILTFLHPPDILSVLTMPISKTWLANYSRQTELWRVLCLLEPFKAKADQVNDSNECLVSFPFNDESGRKQYFGKFRLLYTSFVRCMRYLIRIKDDAVNGRPTSATDFGTLDGRFYNISANRSLHHFLSQARGAVTGAACAAAAPRVTDQVARAAPINLSDEESLATNTSISKKESKKKSKTEQKVRYGHSKLTQRLLGPAANGIVRDVELPWSCGIFSIVNWMVAFTDVEGIQTMCLKVLPYLLENEQQRVTAQRAGLTDIVLRAMVLFPDSSQLHTAAFHTIVILARPLGGQEGMLLHTSMVNSFGIFSSQGGSQDGRSGVAVLLDSMRRFRHDNVLQSMGCWSLVNVALAPTQKMILVALGGIEVIIQAMTHHPYDAELQFRALFALINLVIPSVPSASDSMDLENRDVIDVQSGSEILDEMVNQIAHLVVLAMKNFCSNEAILNRACLVLHNLSLTAECNEALLWTPGCYQMLEWCLANYRTDQVLQQSAAGTLHRLQTTLSRSEGLRERFSASIRAQQQSSLENAHAEAVRLHQQYSEVEIKDPEL
jgi:hypothetical protein